MALSRAILWLAAWLGASSAALAAQQLGTQLEYSAAVIEDRQGADELDFEEIRNFDCSKIQGYVTFIEGDLRVNTIGSYELEIRTTRLFGREKEDAQGAKIAFPEDDKDCREGSFKIECPLGNFRIGKGCFNELRLPQHPSHSTDYVKEGPDLIGVIKSASDDAKKIDFVVSVAQLQRSDRNGSAPTDDDFGRVMEASQDHLLKSLVDVCFMQKFARFDKAKREGRKDAASELDSPCLKPPDK